MKEAVKKKVEKGKGKQNQGKNQPVENSEKSFLEKHAYLERIVAIDPEDPNRFICKLCSSNQRKNSGETRRLAA